MSLSAHHLRRTAHELQQRSWHPEADYDQRGREREQGTIAPGTTTGDGRITGRAKDHAAYVEQRACEHACSKQYEEHCR